MSTTKKPVSESEDEGIDQYSKPSHENSLPSPAELNARIQAEVNKAIASMLSQTTAQGVAMPQFALDVYDKDDVLDKAVPFYAFSTRYSIWDDRKFGMVDIHPFKKPVIFEHAYTIQNGKGYRDTKFIQVCMYFSRSSKETTYLRNHSAYGIEFFEEGNKPNDVDYAKEILNYEAATRLKEMSQFDIVQLARLKGLPASTDLLKLRLQLVPLVADDMEKENTKLRKARVIGSDYNVRDLENQKGVLAQTIIGG